MPWTNEADPVKRRTWYTDDELNAVQVVKTDRGDGSYSSPATCSARSSRTAPHAAAAPAGRPATAAARRPGT
ncbi:hypothetical protein [Nonomuraea sp. NEAU-A123]|uniref:hypothetical protein n=1 Tax=Nonomuraea sp. NEAU-A123 TaxID=2839649 RepID=UPI001BE43896|nr:hypothetical protein [Nonomuraea sp. NEAU-A123]MBT2232053.1 hypothetical protein [Nonomuraea sp. NEAU-A123]